MTNASQKETRPPLDGSLFSLLRCIIAVAHADGKIHDDEMNQLGQLLYSLGRVYTMSPQQMATFERDMAKSPNIEITLMGVTDPQQRCMIINFANIMTRVDGELHPKESEMLKKLQAAVPETPANKTHRAEIQKSVMQEMAAFASDTQHGEKKGGMSTYVLRALLRRLGIELQA